MIEKRLIKIFNTSCKLLKINNLGVANKYCQNPFEKTWQIYAFNSIQKFLLQSKTGTDASNFNLKLDVLP